MATFLVIWFALIATVTVINLLGFPIRMADFGTEYFQGAIPQATLGCALALTGNMPPTSQGESLSVFLHKQATQKKCVDWGNMRKRLLNF